ncbi:hypothetical protein D5F01_LYC18287 [Larimichthys crocea]|uniref:Uncharacterized protein n=1 Tax=Larimichthys crocea TaxID=215358 RepID=A0A6G0HUL2_LARCR|nr:hypothetical protein D5F01_LYC18287 [Larimichthys crocea]
MYEIRAQYTAQNKFMSNYTHRCPGYLLSHSSSMPVCGCAPLPASVKPGPPPPPPPRSPRSKRGESDPYIHPRLRRSTAAQRFSLPLPPSPAALPSPPARPATHGERRAGEAVAAATTPSLSPLPTTWPANILRGLSIAVVLVGNSSEMALAGGREKEDFLHLAPNVEVLTMNETDP